MTGKYAPTDLGATTRDLVSLFKMAFEKVRSASAFPHAGTADCQRCGRARLDSSSPSTRKRSLDKPSMWIVICGRRS